MGPEEEKEIEDPFKRDLNSVRGKQVFYSTRPSFSFITFDVSGTDVSRTSNKLTRFDLIFDLV